MTVGLTCGGRFPAHQVLPYMAAQVVGAIAAAALLYVIASGSPDFDISKGFAANGFGDHSPGKYGLNASLVSMVAGIIAPLAACHMMPSPGVPEHNRGTRS